MVRTTLSSKLFPSFQHVCAEFSKDSCRYPAYATTTMSTDTRYASGGYREGRHLP